MRICVCVMKTAVVVPVVDLIPCCRFFLGWLGGGALTPGKGRGGERGEATLLG